MGAINFQNWELFLVHLVLPRQKYFKNTVTIFYSSCCNLNPLPLKFTVTGVQKEHPLVIEEGGTLSQGKLLCQLHVRLC